MPWQNGLRYPADNVRSNIINALTEIKENTIQYGLDLKIYYVFWRHLGQAEVSASDVEKLSEDFSKFSFRAETSSFDVKLIFVESYDELLRSQLLEGLMLDQRNMIISK